MRSRCCCKAATSRTPRRPSCGLSAALLTGVPKGVERPEPAAEATREAHREALRAAVHSMGASGIVR